MRFELTKDFLELLNSSIQEDDISWMEQHLFVLHHADIASILEELDVDDSIYIYNLLNEELQGDVIVDLDEELRDTIIRTFSSKEIAEQLEHIDSDDAADLVSELPQDQVEEIIGHIADNETAEDIVDLLNYEPDTAGGLMQKEFIQAQAEWPVNRCVVELRKQAEEVEKIFTIYVVDEHNKLVGFLSLKRLLFASPTTKIIDLYQNKNIISVKTSDDNEEVARIMEKYDLVSVPVVDIQNKLVGRITIDDVVDVIMDEADKDFQLASGISENIESSDSVWRISRARIPWLLIGLLGGVFGAQVISMFEGGISEVPQLAFFIPLITAMGGNVGVQSSAIVVQSLARGTDQFGSILKKILKESLVGVVNGLLLSIIIYGIAFVFDSATLGLVVSISLFTVVIFAAIFGTLIPLLLDKYKIDPALATGPFITTLNDVLGLFIYLMIGVLAYGV
ncbi:MAG: magnesium transporter [Crocinitomicaceae bacterium]|nr:magnesium transporter [Crocinitomicaceae bacterium]